MSSYSIRIIKFACLVVGLVAALGSLLFYPDAMGFFYGALAAGLLLLGAGLFMQFWRRKTTEEREIQGYVSAFIAQELTRSRRYQRPLFLVFSDNNRALDQLFHSLGLELFMPQVAQEAFVEAWYGNDCLMFHVKQPEAVEEYSHLWQSLLVQVKQRRPRQPLNGVLLDCPLMLLSLNPQQQDAYFDSITKHLARACMLLQQKLPVLFIFSGLAKLAGFDLFCKSLHRDELLSPVGDIRPTGNDDSIGQWFVSSWQQLLHRIYQRQTESVGQIYDSNQAAGGLEVLFQLSTLGHQLNTLMARYCEAMLTQGADIAGYFICPPELGEERFDGVASYCQACFAAGSPRPWEVGGAEYHNAFLRNIFATFLVPVALRAGVNKRAQWVHYLFSASQYALCILLLYLSSWWLYQNYATERAIVQQTRQVVRDYEANTDLLVTARGSVGSLGVMVDKLTALAELLVEYQRVPRQLLLSRMSHKSLRLLLEDYYREQLRLRLTPYLITAFAGALQQQMQTGSVLSVFESLRLYQMLFDPYPPAVPELIARARALLAGPAGLGRQSSEQLEQRLQDYFGLTDYVIYAPDMKLVAKARGQLEGLTRALLVYSRIKVMQEFRQTMPVANLLGPNFNEVFVLSRESTCSRQHAMLYTAGGWGHALLSADSPLIKNSIQDTLRMHGGSEQVVPETFSNTVDAVRRRFAQEYIAYWHNLLGCIRLRNTVSVGELVDTVTYLAQLGVSPMTDVLEAVKAHTLFRGNLEPSVETGSDVLTRFTEFHHHDQFLASAFTDYHRLIDDSRGAEFFRSLHKNLAPVLENLMHLRSADNGSEIAFGQVRQLATGHHPVQTLLIQAQGQPAAVRQWIQQLVSQWATLYFRLARQHIERQWLKELVTPWHQSVAGRFPVYGDGTQQLDPQTFQAVFGPNGWIDAFHSLYIKPFINNDQQLLLAEHEMFRFTPELQAFFRRARVIRQFFFSGTGEPVDSYIYLKVLSLNSDSTHYRLSDGSSGMVYRHGPSSWQKYVMSIDDDERVLTSSFHDVDQQQSARTYPGSWSWLRFMRESVLEKSGDKTVNLRHRQGEHETLISVKSASGKNIAELLASFRRMALPEAIFL